MTVHTPEGRSRPYDDVLGADGLPRYKMRADARSSADNRAVQEAIRLGLSVIWLVGVAPGWFQPVFPVYVIGEEPEHDQFVLAYDHAQQLPITASPFGEVLRRYVARETRQRLHQPVFRSMVLRAYDTQCAVCALRHGELLDAAHIVDDSHEAGVAAVRNGLALCKIHHAAYDTGILGISPRYAVAIRDDILAEVDGAPTALVAGGYARMPWTPAPRSSWRPPSCSTRSVCGASASPGACAAGTWPSSGPVWRATRSARG